MPSSATRLVGANMNACAAAKSAPGANSVFASADAAYEQDEEIARTTPPGRWWVVPAGLQPHAACACVRQPVTQHRCRDRKHIAVTLAVGGFRAGHLGLLPPGSRSAAADARQTALCSAVPSWSPCGWPCSPPPTRPDHTLPPWAGWAPTPPSAA